MNKLLYLPLAIVFFMASCESATEEKTTTSADTADVIIEPVVNIIETDGKAKAVARLAIEGMGCEMACGGAIKKALGNMDGVVVADIDFDSEEDIDFAIVEYDESKVSGQEMIDAVHALRKGQYTVSGLTIDKFVKGGKPEAHDLAPKSGKDAAAQRGDANIQMRSIALPNLFDILNRF